MKYKFSELSFPCKVGIIGGWMGIIYFSLIFIAGMILGLFGLV